MTSASLAEWSNLAVYASMLILIGALVAFAISFAAKGQRVLTQSLVTVGGTPVEAGVMPADRSEVL